MVVQHEVLFFFLLGGVVFFFLLFSYFLSFRRTRWNWMSGFFFLFLSLFLSPLVFLFSLSFF